jgi:hypothetical protein
MRSHFGSRNEAVIQHIVSRLEQAAETLEEDGEEEEAGEYRDKVAGIARAVVMNGAPVPGLGREEDPHFDVATVLATYQQTTHDVGSNGWKMQAFWELQRHYGRKMDPAAQRLLAFLTDGRPLFGAAMEIDWSYYAYLTHQEVHTFLTALRQLQAAEPSLMGKQYLDGFVDTLMSWLAAIGECGMDLFLYAV